MIAGRHSVEPNLAKSLVTRNHSLDDLFAVKTLMLEEKKKKKDKSDTESDSDDELCEDENCQYVEKVGVSFIEYNFELRIILRLKMI